MEVFKFGGASIKDSERIANVADILKSFSESNILLVVSALDKSTNALEVILEHYCDGDIDMAIENLEELKANHYRILESLMSGEKLISAKQTLNDTFVEIEWILEENFEGDFNYTYDQLVSMGELMSTKMLIHYFRSENMDAVFFDARDAIKTDNTYREAKVDWQTTCHKIQTQVKPLVEAHHIVLTQGFIGSTSENFNTTLGREGSDFTAAIFGYCLEVNNIVIWKDVDGILSGDPAKLNDVELVEKLSFKEAVEMTYYGAKVIHPKTIKPLQNKGIPLHVRSFINPKNAGTIISNSDPHTYPPITVIESDQVLMHIKTRDFSFIAEDHLNKIFKILNSYHVKMRIMRNSAVSFTISILHPGKSFDNLIRDLGKYFEIEVSTGLVLYTIRHYNDEVIEKRIGSKKILFEEKYSDTIQLIVDP